MQKQHFYIIGAVAMLIIFVIILIVILKKREKYKLQKEVQELERQRNLITSTPIPIELAKIEVIIKNEKMEEKYKSWQERYRVIKEERFSEITDILLEIDGLLENNDIKAI